MMYFIVSDHKRFTQRGFTILEMAVVMVILGLILGSMLMPLSSQRSVKRYAETETILKEISDALVGYAVVNGRLPCPASAGSNGDAVPNTATTNCTSDHGFVPGRTLGLVGAYDTNNRYLDSWNNPIRYSLTDSNTGAHSNQIVLGLTPDFRVCAESACSAVIVNNAVFVLVSQGEDGVTGTSADQQENTDGDDDFVRRDISEASGNEFDDLVHWMSPNTLTLHLLNAGQLD